MSTILFKLFGLNVTVKLLVILAIVGGSGYFIYRKVTGHFEYVQTLEDSNKTLTTKVSRIEGERDQAIEINQLNQQAQRVEQEARTSAQEIAAAERAAATARTQTYKEIRNAIQSSPISSAPASSIVRDTLDRLWTDEPVATRSSGSNP
jgi:uncharacterized protein YxeA